MQRKFVFVALLMVLLFSAIICGFVYFNGDNQGYTEEQNTAEPSLEPNLPTSQTTPELTPEPSDEPATELTPDLLPEITSEPATEPPPEFTPQQTPEPTPPHTNEPTPEPVDGPTSENLVFDYVGNRLSIERVERLEVLGIDGVLDSNEKSFIDIIIEMPDEVREIILNRGIIEDEEISGQELEFITQLASYPAMLVGAFLQIETFSADFTIQPGESALLNYSQILFDYSNVKTVSQVEFWESSELVAFLETLQLYDSLSSDLNDNQTILLNQAIFEFNNVDLDDYGGEEEKEEEYAELFSELNPFMNESDVFTEIFNHYGVDLHERREFIKNLVHVIWVEGNRYLPWSISEYDEDALGSLFDIGYYEGCWSVSGGSVDGFRAALLITEGANDRIEAVEKILDWSRENMVHLVSGRTRGDTYGFLYPENPEDPPLWAALIKKYGGCHFFSAVASGLLRSINIPAEETHLGDYLETLDWIVEYNYAHGFLYLPYENLYIHGDEMHYTDFPLPVNSSRDLIFSELGFRGFNLGIDVTFSYVDSQLGGKGVDMSDLWGENLYFFGIQNPSLCRFGDGWRFIIYEVDRSNIPWTYYYYFVYTTIDGEVTETEELESTLSVLSLLGYQ